MRQFSMAVVALIVTPLLAVTTSTEPATASSLPGSSLLVNTSLASGRALVSSNQQYQFAVQTDGNLVLYNSLRIPLWSNHVTNLTGANALTLQRDGNLVEFSPSVLPVWSSKTTGAAAVKLVLQDDGNLVLYGSGGALWSTGTGADQLLPEGLTSVDGSSQIVVVKSTTLRSTYATVTEFQLTSAGWVQSHTTMFGRIGRNGWRTRTLRREGDGTSPLGIFTLGTTIYGNARNPGVRFGYHRLIPGDYWDENPAAHARYNTFQHSTNANCASNPFGGGSECLWLETAAYPQFAVINFNTPSRGGYGSAIFIHVSTRTTEGCLGISGPDLLSLLRWLSPADQPRIVMAGPSNLAMY